MKQNLRKIFSPILNLFESDDAAFAYKPSHRKILIILGSLFSSLAGFVLYLAIGNDLGYLFPVLIFGGVGLLSLLVGLLGTDQAVSKLWGTRK